MNQHSKSKLLKSDDYWAIWLGSFFLVVGVVAFLIIGKLSIGEEIVNNTSILDQQSKEIPFKTIDWYKAKDKVSQLTGANTSIGKSIKRLLSKPKSWNDNPLKSFLFTGKEIETTDLSKLGYLKRDLKILEKKAIIMEQNARVASFENNELNSIANVAAESWHQLHEEIINLDRDFTQNSYNILPGLLLLAVVLAVIFGLGAYFMGYNYLKFIIAFIGIFILATLSYLLAAQTDMKSMGISYAVWAILFGLIISNTIGTPAWLKPAIQTEYFIKTGLVLLGAEILLGKIMTIGLPGIFVSWVVTPIVLVTAFWFGQKILKIGSKTLNITISADMSVCGVSAAIATAAACNAKKEELTLAIGLSMVFTSIMMIGKSVV